MPSAMNSCSKGIYNSAEEERWCDERRSLSRMFSGGCEPHVPLVQETSNVSVPSGREHKQALGFKALGSNFSDLKFSCKLRHKQGNTSKQENRSNKVCALFISEPKSIYSLCSVLTSVMFLPTNQKPVNRGHLKEKECLRDGNSEFRGKRGS